MVFEYLKKNKKIKTEIIFINQSNFNSFMIRPISTKGFQRKKKHESTCNINTSYSRFAHSYLSIYLILFSVSKTL